ncbi:trypsin Inhibitor like cysteine rich domain protein [Ancylostoma duodenale]|uniref:Trypsin Inhibitor like cysteine rich domain protein n=1 Tax=Ancylostoma duodenale TaxID=51022 RepID=A0A0C2FZY3_9BILA|nr:trypsin Inhibitor like cysteine rich domain protein [Ancylostoma duodenale]
MPQDLDDTNVCSANAAYVLKMGFSLEILQTPLPALLLIFGSNLLVAHAKCCPPNEEFKECGTACEPNCNNTNPQACTKQCILDVCQCKQGFYRNSAGNCVDSCYGEPCGENEKRLNSSSICEPTCDDRNPICIMIAVQDVCRCVKGYIRQYANGPCIPARECPPPDPETCETKQCPPGTICQQDQVFCKRPPCPQPPPRCVRARNCNNIRCRPGYTCQMIVAPCLPDIQCPPPFPECVPICECFTMC